MELKHIPYLDGWRGVAILLVLIGHFFDLPGSRLGVEVFFVLSGMLMSRVLFDQKLSLKTFYRRRFARILPVYYIYLATMAILASTLMPPVAWKHFALSAVFLTSYMPSDVVRSSLPLTHLWSLNVEEHSYVFLSLVALIFKDSRAVRFILTIAAGACVAFYAIYYYFPVDQSNGVFRTECAALPLIASAALHLWLKKIKSTTGIVLFYISILGLFASVVWSRKLGGSIGIDYIAKPLFVAVMLNTLALAPRILHTGLQASWLRWLGVCSYSLYIWHPVVLELSMTVSPSRWIALSVALIAGAASFFIIEDPLRKLIRNRGLWSQPAPATLT